MKLQSIEAFLATVRTGSIRAAARALDLSQPAISKTLKALEDELGVPLLTRSAKGIDLTDYGRAFFVRATTIWNESSRARDELRQMRGARDGRVSLALSPAVAIRLGPIAIRNFRREYPEVTVHLFEGLEPYAVSKLRTGEIELAVCPVYTELSHKEFIVEPLLNTRMHIVARKGHPLSAARSLKELQTADWVHVGAGGNLAPLIVNLYQAHNLKPPKVTVECYSFTSSVSMIMHTDMLALMPEAWTSQADFACNFTQIAVAEAPLVNHIHLLYRRDQPLTPVAQKLVTHFLRLAEV